MRRLSRSVTSIATRTGDPQRQIAARVAGGDGSKRRHAMRRIKLAAVACASLLAVALAATPAGAADPAPAADTSKGFRVEKIDADLARAWECQAGYSCYFDSPNGNNWMFNAARCGVHDLMGGIYQNRISSIYNRGNGAVHVYQWISTGWRWMGTVPINRYAWWTGSWENEIDMIDIDC